jgi:predicted transposase/invertase (TIGR01784 family)
MSRQLEELNLIDNFLFSTAIDHEEFGPVLAKTVLETILQREVTIGRIISERVIVPEKPGLHGIRLDAFIQEDVVDVAGGEVFDLEPDNKSGEKKNLPKRARYYHSKIDGKLLQSMAAYANLPKLWVIFITSYDPFGAGRMVYTVRRKCEELPELEYDDGDETLYLYVKGEPEKNTSKELIQLLHFLGETNRENACNPGLRKLLEYIDDLRRDPDVKEAYMHWEVFIQSERDEAREKGREEERVKTRIEAARADAAEEELARTKAELDALKREVQKSGSTSI